MWVLSKSSLAHESLLYLEPIGAIEYKDQKMNLCLELTSIQLEHPRKSIQFAGFFPCFIRSLFIGCSDKIFINAPDNSFTSCKKCQSNVL